MKFLNCALLQQKKKINLLLHKYFQKYYSNSLGYTLFKKKKRKIYLIEINFLIETWSKVKTSYDSCTRLSKKSKPRQNINIVQIKRFIVYTLVTREVERKEKKKKTGES